MKAVFVHFTVIPHTTYLMQCFLFLFRVLAVGRIRKAVIASLILALRHHNISFAGDPRPNTRRPSHRSFILRLVVFHSQYSPLAQRPRVYHVRQNESSAVLLSSRYRLIDLKIIKQQATIHFMPYPS